MSAKLPRYWAHLKSPDFARLDAARTVAVLPVAACEQHGPHLPLSVDVDLLEGVLALSLPHLPADAPVLILPTQSVGRSIEHESFAGTLGVDSSGAANMSTYGGGMALLLKNGNAASGGKGLPAGVPVYVEHSNEVWK
jgi:hypothetical protein